MILIKNTTVLTLESEKAQNNFDIVISGDKISYLGKAKLYKANFEKIIDGSKYIALPGFVNTHSHLAMSYFRGYANDLSLKKWLFDYIFPLEDKLTEDDVYFGTLISCIESIKTGTTTISDFYMFPKSSIRAVKECGLRGNIGFAFQTKPGLNNLILRKAEEFYNKFNGIENGRIIVSLAPHSTYTCTKTLLKETSVLSRKINAVIQIHLHETENEVNEYAKKNGVSPIVALNEIGFFNAKVLAAHCVHINDEELKILKSNNVSVTINPQSNLKLGSGIPQVHKFLASGIRISVGTDGPSSNNNLSVLEDLRLFTMLAKGISKNPELLKPIEALRIGTLNGSINLGFENTGLLKENHKADLMLVNKEKVNLLPETDIASHILYSMYPTDVEYLFVDGKLILEKGKITTIDEEEVIKEFKKRAKRIFKNAPQ